MSSDFERAIHLHNGRDKFEDRILRFSELGRSVPGRDVQQYFGLRFRCLKHSSFGCGSSASSVTSEACQSIRLIASKWKRAASICGLNWSKPHHDIPSASSKSLLVSKMTSFLYVTDFLVGEMVETFLLLYFKSTS